MIIGIGVCAFLAFCGIVGLAMCKAAGHDEEERLKDDQAQMDYLRKWREDHK